MRCEVRFYAPDGRTVLATTGTTRDVSRSGLGFLSPEHFRRRAPLLVSLPFSQAPSKHLAGTAVYSRRIREGWYLTGMQFGKTDHAALIANAHGVAARGTGPTPASANHAAGGTPATDRKPQSSDEEEALQHLASRTFTSRLTKDRIQKVVTWSMASDHAVRRATIPVLMQIGSGVATQALVRLLDDPNHTIQGEAAEALGQLRDTSAIEPLKNLLQHPSEDVTLRAALALAQMNDRSGLRVASRILQSDSPLNRRAARTFGVIVGRGFRPNSVGLAAARKYLSTNHLD